MKRIFIVIAIVFSLSFLFGFSYQPEKQYNSDFIMLSLDFSSNGQIIQSIDFSVNSERLNNESISLKETLDFKNALKKQVESLRNEFLFGFALNYMQNPIEEYKINKGIVISAVTFDEENDTIGFKIGFSSINSWNYYHKSKSNSLNKNIFLNKISSEGSFPFSANIQTGDNKTQTVGERYKEKYLLASEGLSFHQKFLDMYQPIFVYNYSSFNTKLRSDADYNFYDGQNHLHHLWYSSLEDITIGKNITIYFYSIQKGNWILFALGLSLLIMFAVIIAIKIKERKRH